MNLNAVSIVSAGCLLIDFSIFDLEYVGWLLCFDSCFSTYYLPSGMVMVNCVLILELGLWIFFSFDLGFVVSQDTTGILHK